MSETIKTIAQLQNARVIYIVDYRKSTRTGLDIPLYSLSPRTKNKLDIHSLLAGVISERLVEYKFVARNLVPKGSEAVVVDIGSSGSGVAEAIEKFGKRYRVFGIDLARQGCDARMDARLLGFSDNSIDQVISTSTIEHIGLSCNIDDKSGDKKAMKEIFRVLKQGASAIVTIPFGREGKKEYRIYDTRTLDRLVSKFTVAKKEYYRYDSGKWRRCNQTEAEGTVATVPSGFHSAVCVCLLLKKQ
ncbi:MAG: class I SAM-dependent methyltransferase [Nitrososphaera sp.]|nr:class I SAM-dependent methyltransferase [Nitrososphaera sp.]